MFGRWCAAVVLACGGAVAAAAQGQPIAYADFIKLQGEAQRAAFRRADPATRAALLREHAQRWLQQHHGRLDAEQVAAVKEGIAFITPSLYERPGEERLAQEDALLRRLVCKLGRDDVRAAFTFEPPPPARSFWSMAEEWIDWMRACLAG